MFLQIQFNISKWMFQIWHTAKWNTWLWFILLTGSTGYAMRCKETEIVEQYMWNLNKELFQK